MRSLPFGIVVRLFKFSALIFGVSTLGSALLCFPWIFVLLYSLCFACVFALMRSIKSIGLFLLLELEFILIYIPTLELPKVVALAFV